MSKINLKMPRAHQELIRMVDLYKSGETQKAHSTGLKFLTRHGQNFDVLHLLGTIDLAQGRLQDAWIQWTLALKQIPTHVLLLNKLGALARKLGKDFDAEFFFQKAIDVDINQPEAYFNLANCQAARGDWLPAIQSYTNSIERNPDFVQAYNNLAIALQDFGRPDEAVKVLETAIIRFPDEARLHINKARSLQGMSLGKAAVAYLRESLVKFGSDFEVLTVLADMEVSQNDYTTAEIHYVEALKLKPDADVVHNNFAIMLQAKGQLDSAMDHYIQAFTLNPTSYQALQNLCNILNARKDYAQSLKYLEKVRAINPNSPYLAGMHMNALMHTCSWGDWQKHVNEVEVGVSNGLKTVNPFPPLAFFTNASLQKQSAELWSKNECPERGILPMLQFKPRLKDRKIRVGYYSADLHAHATALLMAGVLESHNRERFEWFAFSFGPIQENALSVRIRAAFDQFIDVRSYSDRVVAQLSREMDIDIAVDLKGYTQEARTGIFAERAAPIQVNYLGYPGSMGAPYIDYIIADSVIIPNELKKHYSEAVIRLPYCYQANDNQRPISAETPSRVSQGLPEQGRVLCSFNNNYKITPEIFNVWMRVLNRFPDCVLWLLQDNPLAAENLKLEAEIRGISPSRLVFAPRMRNDDHLARHRLADLFIDTFPCNAHTTASDALWAGLPIISLAGETFASRVAASLLTAIDMNDCVTYDFLSYEQKIVSLLDNPQALQDLRDRVVLGCQKSPLFDTSATAQQLELAYLQMMVRFEAELPPKEFDVQP
jgi:predicted O-linked N-acetylglucosamine transferase (SPINDLY family)